jgi:uncharacterized membrane protein
MHPIMVHFPVGLLLVTPLFIVIGAVLPPMKARPWMLTALILMALGTASLFLAVPTGEAAAQAGRIASSSPTLLETHQQLALETRGIFTMLLAIYVGVMLVPVVLHQQSRLFSTILPVSFLLLYSAGAVLLVNTARAGTELAHPSESSAMSVPCEKGLGHSGM